MFLREGHTEGLFDLRAIPASVSNPAAVGFLRNPTCNDNGSSLFFDNGDGPVTFWRRARAVRGQVIFVALVCPVWLLLIEPTKRTINGPWDIAHVQDLQASMRPNVMRVGVRHRRRRVHSPSPCKRVPMERELASSQPSERPMPSE